MSLNNTSPNPVLMGNDSAHNRYHQPVSLASLLAQLKKRLWVQAALGSLSVGLVVLALSTQVMGHPMPILGLGSVLLTLGFHAIRYRPLRWTTATFAQYLNRRIPALEESAGLWLLPESSLTTLQRLQRRRVAAIWDELEQSSQGWLPPVNVREPLGVLAVGLVLAGTYALLALDSKPSDGVLAALDKPVAQDQALASPSLLRIHVEPPVYTHLPAFTVTEADVTVPEGATLRWFYRGDQLSNWQLVLSDAARRDRRFKLQQAANKQDAGASMAGHNANSEAGASAVASVDATSLYYLAPSVGSGNDDYSPTVHSIRVTLDQPPRIRVVTPSNTRVEFAKNAEPLFDYAVTIADDYGVTEVEIRASIAKGSGEGVKFRDARFVFEHSRAIDEGVLYEQHWDLRDLGMTPGDELYLFTRAYDNHPEEPHTSRSDTVVVRWLDEIPEIVGEDGLAISVMPEYFKSQRQIIIETEQLLADKPNLSPQVFVATSRALGVDQGALKERYGQYVGDEFGESEAPQGLIDGPVTASGSNNDGNPSGDHDDHDGHDHGADDGHDHGVGTSAGDDGLFAKGEALMARFGHDHGAADIGPISRQSPVGLMKRALANMWDAELHLRLGDPQTALPFEREALRYFDLARKAQRIYTQRLGFEPPPISEDRRLTGDLTDVQSKVRAQQATPDSNTKAVLANTYRWLLSTPDNRVFSTSELALLESATAVLTDEAEARPGFIRAAALLTQLVRRGRMDFGDCSDCRQVLQQTLWSALPPLVVPAGQALRSQPNSLAERYQARLQQLRQGAK